MIVYWKHVRSVNDIHCQSSAVLFWIWMNRVVLKYALCHQSCKDFASKGLQQPGYRTRGSVAGDHCHWWPGQTRGPRPEPDPLTEYNTTTVSFQPYSPCQPSPVAQSADIDPLNANKTLAWIFVTQLEKDFHFIITVVQVFEDEGI